MTNKIEIITRRSNNLISFCILF